MAEKKVTWKSGTEVKRLIWQCQCSAVPWGNPSWSSRLTKRYWLQRSVRTFYGEIISKWYKRTPRLFQEVLLLTWKHGSRGSQRNLFRLQRTPLQRSSAVISTKFPVGNEQTSSLTWTHVSPVWRSSSGDLNAWFTWRFPRRSPQVSCGEITLDELFDTICLNRSSLFSKPQHFLDMIIPYSQHYFQTLKILKQPNFTAKKKLSRFLLDSRMLLTRICGPLEILFLFFCVFPERIEKTHGTETIKWSK